MRVEIERFCDKDKLQRVVMSFYVRCDFDGITVEMDSYYRQSRSTRRHHFKTVKKWDRIDSRGNNIIKPDLDAATISEAIDKVRDTIKWRV